jgi:hypothetical protein
MRILTAIWNTVRNALRTLGETLAELAEDDYA